jgi:hypothetical protein
MAKDPAFLFYSGDFLTGVTGMNMEERGQYITLLCLQHAKGHLTLELMNRSVPGLSSYVLEKFQQDEDGLYFNQRLEEEAIKRNKFCKSRSENRKGKENKDMINICETSVLHMENENVNSNDIVLGSNVNNKGIAKIEKNLPAKTNKKTGITWNENDPQGMLKMRGHEKKKLTEEQFVQVLIWEGKKAVPNYELVWLTDEEWDKLVSNLENDKNLAKKAIETVYRYKLENEGIRQYVSDYLACLSYGAKQARYSAKAAGYDPSKERQKEKIRKDNLNLFNEA